MGQPRYGPEAIDYCFKLYLKYGGEHYERIEKEMHKAGWVGWKAQNLRDRGKHSTKRGVKGTFKEGWVSKFGWEKALKEHQARKVAPTLSSAEALVRDVEFTREGLAAEIRAKGVAKSDKERLQLLRDFCNLQISALTKVEAARDTLSAWVNFLERLIPWAVDVDAKLGRLLLKHSESLIARAVEEFGEEPGESEELNMNAEPSSEAGAEPGT